VNSFKIFVLISFFSFTSCFGATTIQEYLFIADSLGKKAKHQESLEYIDVALQEIYQSEKLDVAIEQKALQLKAHYLSDNNENVEALQLALQVIDKAQKYNLSETELLAHLTAELIYEKNEDFVEAKKHLDLARNLYSIHHLDSLYAIYCIRLSSFYRLTDQVDSALFYAEEALKSSLLYNQEEKICEAHLLVGINLYLKAPFEAIEHYKFAAKYFNEFEKYDAEATMYNNISSIYKRQGQLDKAFLYNDTAISIYHEYQIPFENYIYGLRAKLFELNGQYDSAYYYLNLQYEMFKDQAHENAIVEIKKITEEFQNDKNQLIIQNQKDINEKQKMLLYLLSISIVLALVLIILLFKWRKKLQLKNIRIKQQSEEIQQSLLQKETLLQEVQHRIKNNLQIIIGLLEFQKGKHQHIEDKNITEENQNRIKAMAILQDKIYLSNNVDNVNLNLYLDEIAQLQLDYFHHKQLQIKIEKKSNFENVSIDKANLIGLIMIELINNSYKHAFKNINDNPLITIEINKIAEANFNCLISYRDNGNGFETKKNKSKGFGMEIINGLVNQMNGKVIMQGENGFFAEIKLKL